jgi:excisionase family DNA binding protein
VKGLFDKDGAAEYLSTSARRIDELRRAGELIAVEDGREFKFNREALDEYRLSRPTFEPGQRRAS